VAWIKHYQVILYFRRVVADLTGSHWCSGL